MMIGGIRMDDRGGEMRMIGRIRITLCFKAKPVPFVINSACLAGNVWNIIAGVKLHTRLIGFGIHQNAALRRIEPCGKHALLTVQHAVVIVSAGHGELLEILLDSLADHMPSSEVEWCSLDRRNRTVRTAGRIIFSILIGGDQHPVSQRTAAVLPV